jgi:chromosome segregation ATPase
MKMEGNLESQERIKKESLDISIKDLEKELEIKRNSRLEHAQLISESLARSDDVSLDVELLRKAHRLANNEIANLKENSKIVENRIAVVEGFINNQKEINAKVDLRFSNLSEKTRKRFDSIKEEMKEEDKSKKKFEEIILEMLAEIKGDLKTIKGDLKASKDEQSAFREKLDHVDDQLSRLLSIGGLGDSD